MSDKLLFKRFGGYILFIILLAGVVNAFSASSTAENLAICPGTTTLVAVTVTGDGQYTVGLSGSAARWGTAVPLGFVLSESKSKTVYVYVTPIKTALAGNYGLDITITNGRETQTISKVISVLSCYKVNIGVTEGKSICPDTDVKYEFNVMNTGSFRETYSLKVGGNAADWVVLSENKIDLEGGESKTVFAYAKVPLSARGLYDFSLTAIGDTTNSVSTSTASLNVEACYDYGVDTPKDFYEVCDRTTEIVPIRITNDGTVSNNYKLNLDGPAWSDLEKKTISIGPGASDVVNLLISPDYDTTGEFTFVVTVDDVEGQIRATKVLNAKVRDCHDVIIDLPASDGLCAALTKSYTATITNNGEFAEKFDLFVEGARWAGVDKLLLDLESGQSEDVNLEISPGIDDAGSYNIRLIAKSLDRGIEGSDVLQMQIVSQKNCYSPNLEIQEDSIEVSSGASATIPVVIANKGTEKAAYVIGVSGTASSFVQLNPATVELSPNTAETTYLYIAPVQDTSLGRYGLTISAGLENSPILDTDNIIINVIEYIPPVEPEEEIIEEELAEERGLLNVIWSKIVNFFYGEAGEEPVIEEEITAEIEEIEEELGEVEEEVITEEIEEPLVEEEITGEVVEEIETGEEETAVEEEITEEIVEEEPIVLETEEKENIVIRCYNYAKANRNKVLIGLIVLLLILLILKYRREIIDFFEEDEDLEEELSEEDLGEEITEEELEEPEEPKVEKKKPRKRKSKKK